MTIWANSNIAWIDAETTGLSAQENHLLEIACIVTDKDLNVLDEIGFHAIVWHPSAEVLQMKGSAVPFVREMHTKTGLWSKLANGQQIWQIDHQLRNYLMRFGETKMMPVAGNSVRLDMNFMDKHLPLVSDFLDYHMRDVSTVAGFAEGWYGQPNFKKVNDHTAMTDIRESIREMRHYRDTIFRPVSETVPLNSEQARVMLEAFQYEKDRIRYELNWPANAETSRVNRIRKIKEAVELGVPLRQVQVFIWGEKYFA